MYSGPYKISCRELNTGPMYSGPYKISCRELNALAQCIVVLTKYLVSRIKCSGPMYSGPYKISCRELHSDPMYGGPYKISCRELNALAQCIVVLTKYLVEN